MTSQFIDSPDNEDMMFRKVRNGLEIGVHPVIFGYRIRAGIEGDNTCFLDYCAGSGSDLKEVENIYSLVISIMNKRMDSGLITLDVRDLAHHVFNDFPRQTVKPMCNDFKCFMTLSEMCGSEIISIKLPNLAARKVRHTLTYSPSSFDLLLKMGGFEDLLED